jgi:hypothetical protein
MFTGKIWTLNDGPSSIVVPNVPVKLELKLSLDGDVRLYKMTILAGGANKTAWEAATFVERGQTVLDWPDHLRVETWPNNPTNTVRKRYQDNIETSLRKYTDANTLRLEADVKFTSSGTPNIRRAVIVVAKDAVQAQVGTNPILLVNVSSRLFSSGGPIDDGTAHGNGN